MKYIILSDQNSKLKKDNIVSINLPAKKTCPGAKDCLKYCYAGKGCQLFKYSREKRERTLELSKHSNLFVKLAIEEIVKSKSKIVRLHDSGDIYSLQYLKTLIKIANKLPNIKFYTYTKSIHIINKLGWNNIPNNFRIIQSYGGKYDAQINPLKPFVKVIDRKVLKDHKNASKSDLIALKHDKLILTKR